MSDFLWVEKYRPKTIDECILPAETKSTFNSFVAKGELPISLKRYALLWTLARRQLCMLRVTNP